ncbi:Lrp/AsnC family transcriptional regulator [Flavobacterium sp. W21_SRS_FM6]|uniref:Lrp/AsnC family transcriptional regulator n=1 Tax=Flavobacterium sp. W21_SRS_FM6 TaxID=3240268 RepID=UPI003F8F8227
MTNLENKRTLKALDATDKKILQCLEQDGRMSFATLGEHIGLSKTPCWNRVNELAKQGVIAGYNTRIDPTKLGLTIKALVHVVVDFSYYQAFEAAIIAHPNVRSCQAVTGEYDYVLEILATDIQAFDHLLRENLSQLPGVERFNTAISTRMVKSDGPFTLMR